jgi:hypothetical protein
MDWVPVSLCGCYCLFLCACATRSFLWNPLSWTMEAAAIISIALVDYVDFIVRCAAVHPAPLALSVCVCVCFVGGGGGSTAPGVALCVALIPKGCLGRHS